MLNGPKKVFRIVEELILGGFAEVEKMQMALQTAGMASEILVSGTEGMNGQGHSGISKKRTV